MLSSTEYDSELDEEHSTEGHDLLSLRRSSQGDPRGRTHDGDDSSEATQPYHFSALWQDAEDLDVFMKSVEEGVGPDALRGRWTR